MKDRGQRNNKGCPLSYIVWAVLPGISPSLGRGTCESRRKVSRQRRRNHRRWQLLRRIYPTLAEALMFTECRLLACFYSTGQKIITVFVSKPRNLINSKVKMERSNLNFPIAENNLC